MGLFNWWSGKKPLDAPERQNSGSHQGASAAWKAGDRVLAVWHDSFFYPGRIRRVQGDSCEIGYDDGDVAWAHTANIRKPDVEAGSPVFCRFHAGPLFLPAKVQQQNGEKILVKYESGEQEWTTLSMVRVKRPLANVGPAPAGPYQAPGLPGSPPLQGPMGGSGGGAMTGTLTATDPMMGQPPGHFIPDVGDPVSDSSWRVGDRVLGRWFDFFWYPATILAMGTKGYHLLFDDGDQRVVQDRGLVALDIEEGEELFIRPKNQPQRIYTPARVLRVQGEVVDVELEDGTRETNQQVSRARFWRCPVGFQTLQFEEGDRVWAEDVDGFTYPAEILTIDNDKIMVHFLDGPERMLTPELVRAFAIKVGMAVECRWKGGQRYFPGKITQIQNDRVHVDYDDGDKEWTTVRIVRLTPPGA